jgi:hypothetical protein
MVGDKDGGGGASTQAEPGEEEELLMSGLSLKEKGEKEKDDDGRTLSALFLEGQALVEALEEGTVEGAKSREEKLTRALKLFTELAVGGSVGCVWGGRRGCLGVWVGGLVGGLVGGCED